MLHFSSLGRGGTHLVTNSNAKFSVGLPSIVFGYILTMCSFPLNSHSSEKLLQGAETCHLPNFVSKKLPNNFKIIMQFCGRGRNLFEVHNSEAISKI